jgi:hypothetical protein
MSSAYAVDSVSDLPAPRAPFAPQFTGGGTSSSDTRSIRSAQSSVAAFNRHPDLPTSPGLVASVLEALYATLKDGHVVDAHRTGEIVLGYNGSPSDESLQLRVSGQNYIDRIVPNTAFVQPTTDGTYAINTRALASVHQATMFKFQALGGSTPLVVVPIWRIENNQSSLMLTYRLSDDFPLDRVELSGLTIVVPVEGGRALSAQSKPVASFSKEHQRITWRFNEPVTVTRGAEERLLCRLTTEGPTVEGSSGIDLKFRMSNLPSSGISVGYLAKDPFGDSSTGNGAISPIETVYTTVALRYVAHSESNVQRR